MQNILRACWRRALHERSASATWFINAHLARACLHGRLADLVWRTLYCGAPARAAWRGLRCSYMQPVVYRASYLAPPAVPGAALDSCGLAERRVHYSGRRPRPPFWRRTAAGTGAFTIFSRHLRGLLSTIPRAGFSYKFSSFLLFMTPALPGAICPFLLLFRASMGTTFAHCGL